MQDRSAVTTFLFSDIEGSTRLWEQDPERMSVALAGHDALARAVVERNRGAVVKTTGDGMYAAFADPIDALRAAVDLQHSIVAAAATAGIELRLRCGLHAGVVEHRDNDYYGRAVNRASRIMTAAHGGQVLLSETVAALVSEQLPDQMALRDLGAVRLRDLAHHDHIFQVMHPRLRADFPPLRTLEATPNNLPQQTTSFIGREHELADARKLLERTRLLTLVGAGGLGKTRFSLQLAAEALDDYPDGVWFVELAPLMDAERVPEAVATAMGVKGEPGKPAIDALIRHLHDRKLLLILDNCEHLIASCADFATRALRAGPNMKVLASSREQLRVSGETSFPLPSLTVPAPEQRIELAELAQYEAVRLFVERSTAAQPSFELTAENAIAVAGIARRLDGIPLALELAAARVRSLSVETIARRLDDRFRLLSGGDRTALPRQQTLRASIDWSYDLLTSGERILLRRLAVFAGGFTLEAAEEVCTAGEVHAPDVLELVSRLVDKSLVARVPVGERYALLDTVRVYAHERLVESGEEGPTRARQQAYFLAFAERARPQLIGPEQAAWLSRLDLEFENILAAHTWASRSSGDAALGLKLVSLLKHYWINRGLFDLGHRVIVEALARPGAQDRNFGRSWALSDAGQLSGLMGRYVEAKAFLEESLAIAREIGDKERILVVLQPLGIAHHGQGNRTVARLYFDEALTLAQDVGNRREVAAALNSLAQISREEGDLDTAEPLYERVITLAREVGDRESIAIGLLNLAMVSIGRGDNARAGATLVEVFEIAREIGSKYIGQSLIEVCAGLAASLRDWLHAARYFGAAEAQMSKTGHRRDPSDEAFLAPLIEAARSAAGSEAFAAAEAQGRATTFDQALADVRDWLESRR